MYPQKQKQSGYKLAMQLRKIQQNDKMNQQTTKMASKRNIKKQFFCVNRKDKRSLKQSIMERFGRGLHLGIANNFHSFVLVLPCETKKNKTYLLNSKLFNF